MELVDFIEVSSLVIKIIPSSAIFFYTVELCNNFIKNQ